MTISKRQFSIVYLFLSAALVCSAQTLLDQVGLPEVNQGLGGIKWGASVATVSKKFPDLAKGESGPPECGLDDYHLTSFSDQIEDVVFRFYKDRLILVRLVYSQEYVQGIELMSNFEQLRKKYGQPPAAPSGSKRVLSGKPMDVFTTYWPDFKKSFIIQQVIMGGQGDTFEMYDLISVGDAKAVQEYHAAFPDDTSI